MASMADDCASRLSLSPNWFADFSFFDDIGFIRDIFFAIEAMDSFFF